MLDRLAMVHNRAAPSGSGGARALLERDVASERCGEGGGAGRVAVLAHLAPESAGAAETFGRGDGAIEVVDAEREEDAFTRRRRNAPIDDELEAHLAALEAHLGVVRAGCGQVEDRFEERARRGEIADRVGDDGERAGHAAM